MPVDFHLSQNEAGVRTAAASFAHKVLKPARTEYMTYEDHYKRFQATRSAYAAAATGGLVKGQVAPAIGGTGGSLIEAAILVEECYAVEPAAALTIFATGLGLTPLNLTQKPEHSEFLAPFISSEGTPLASLVFSEPGGVANYLEKGAPGLNTTARREGDEWVINGEKKWATNSAGWDNRGADLACVVCRDITNPISSPDADPKDSIMIILVTRADLERNGGDKCFQVLGEVSTLGHTASGPGPHIKYTNVRVPAKNVLCQPGEAAAVVSGSFDASAVLVGAMSVGVMRAAFDAALAFAKRDDRRGKTPLLQHQAVADLLSGIKMQTEACRALTWKAAHALENGPGDYNARRELALAAKVYCSDAAVKAVMEAINAVGVTAYDSEQPFADLLKNAVALPIFDGGNVGIRRRHLQQLMLSPNYDPWAATYGPSELSE
ncbi:acyl-CoA dehydrogenase domain-containing protein [Whalleya microplaca]|nr:acyl-CoA dehydrogenase domain-containing protein [Whalleya microplaca]